jgi:hypothetical protein
LTAAVIGEEVLPKSDADDRLRKNLRTLSSGGSSSRGNPASGGGNVTIEYR